MIRLRRVKKPGIVLTVPVGFAPRKGKMTITGVGIQLGTRARYLTPTTLLLLPPRRRWHPLRAMLDWPITIFVAVPALTLAGGWFVAESFRHTHVHQSLQIGIWLLLGAAALIVGASTQGKRP